MHQECRHCHCTATDACPEGCHWVEPDLCSVCAETVGLLAIAIQHFASRTVCVRDPALFESAINGIMNEAWEELQAIAREPLIEVPQTPLIVLP
jgi:hypothetical protein